MKSAWITAHAARGFSGFVLRGGATELDELSAARKRFSPVNGALLPLNWSDAAAIRVMIFAMRALDALDEEAISQASE